MISKSYASKILNTLFGTTSTSSYILSSHTDVYLGLCASEPERATGALTSAGEPSTIASYERKKIGGTKTEYPYFGISSNTGVIENSTEIQMKTARENYPAKMNYWFLTTSQTKGNGNAFLWGEIKDSDGNTGITVTTATVPTFYEGELKASIDVALNEEE